MRVVVAWVCVAAAVGCDEGTTGPSASGADGARADAADVAFAGDGAAGDATDPDVATADATPGDAATPDASAPDASTPDAATTNDSTPPAPDAGAPGPPTPLITELMARNVDTLLDEDGDSSDWIEVYNPGGEPYALAGHHLTDDLDAPDKWVFPAVTLAPRGYLVVFASGKDRRHPERPLHTGFRLAGDGETVALTDRAGQVLHAIEDWPGQVAGVAYGLPMRVGRRAVSGAGAPARLWVGPDPPGAQLPDFDDGAWVAVEQGAGVDTRPPERRGDDLVQTDLSRWLGLADVFWLRVPFSVPAGLAGLELELAYDDGVTAWVDGEEVYRHNDVVGAVRDRSESRAAGRTRIPLDDQPEGPGILALRVVDAAADDDLFFVHGRLATLGLVVEERARYLPVPTPGADNIGREAALPPLVADVDRHQPLGAGDALEVGALVLETDAPLASVRLVYRVMFGPEMSVEMASDGQRWRVELPADLAQPGQMIRWAVEATDAAGRVGRFPPYLDPSDSERYVGTMVATEVETSLPVFHWFVEDLEAAGREAGTRAALWYDGELYDNIEVDLHGQATTIFPKKSYNFDFNRDHRFRVRADLERVKDFDLLTNWADKSKIRNTLSYGIFRDAGHDHHLVFPVRVHRNGEFFAVYEFVEDPDERWLRRMGYPEPLGDLYKCYDGLEDPDRSEKKTREEEGNAGLAAFIAGISQQGDARRTYIYDHVDLARMANFLALLFVTAGRDCCSKNYYAYRDPRTDQWWYMPWDIDLSLGRNWTGSYFDDRMFPENPLYHGSNNNLVSSLFAMPEFDEMYLRRARTLSDALMQPPATPYEQRYLENAADQLAEHIGADAELDNAAWGSWGIEQTMAEAVRIMKEDWMEPRRAFIYGQLVQRAGGPVVTLLDGRPGMARARWRVPVDDALGVDWTRPGFDDAAWAEGPLGLGYENDDGAYGPLIRTEVRPQAAHAAATTIMLRVRFRLDAPLADGLVLRMKYDDGYVAWLNGVEVSRRNVGGGPPSWRSEAAVHDDGAAVRFEDVDLSRFADALQPGENVLAIQVVNTGADSSDLLVQPELVDGQPASDGPMPAAQRAEPDVVVDAAVAAGDASYVVVHNREGAAVDLSGWLLEGRGVEHVFADGTVIPTGGRLYLVADVPTFRGRAEGPRGGQGLLLQGNWTGTLEAAGELDLAPGVDL